LGHVNGYGLCGPKTHYITEKDASDRTDTDTPDTKVTPYLFFRTHPNGVGD